MYLPYSKPYDQWNVNDLEKLCDERVAENQRLEYKRELILDPPKQRHELLKDFTALANSLGGIIIYGIEEVNDPELGHVASNLCPMNDATLKDRACRIIQSMTSPGMEFYLRSVPSSESEFFIIAYIPQSENRPHAVLWKNRLDYFIRRNEDIFSMTEPELRKMYFESSLSKSSMRQRLRGLDLEIGTEIKWSLISMPLVSDLELIDTLRHSGHEFTSQCYVMLVGGSNYLRPRVDRFEEIKDNGDHLLVTRLFRHGEFMFSYGFKEILKDFSMNIGLLYYYLNGSIRFFVEMYKKVGYFGPIRLWLLTRGLDHPKLSIGFLTFGVHRKFQRNDFIVSKDSNVDMINDPSDCAGELVRYFAQACGTDLDNQDLSILRRDCLR